MSARPVTRLFDPDVPHCGPMNRADGAKTVFVNGRPWSREFDPNNPHLKPNPAPPPPCIIHTTVIIQGSQTVYPQGPPAGRVFDKLGPDECTTTGEGSPNVFAGG